MKKMSDPLIEGIAYQEPQPGLVGQVGTMAKNFVCPPSPCPGMQEIEEKRESLRILVTTGAAKEYLGTCETRDRKGRKEIEVADVEGFSAKAVEKYYFRYQTKLAKQVTGGLVESALKLGAKTLSKFVPIDDSDSLSDDLVHDKIVKRELTNAAGYLVLKGGRFVALASALFHVVSHVEFSAKKEVLLEKPEHGAEEPEQDAQQI